jgi:hypothetical protein
VRFGKIQVCAGDSPGPKGGILTIAFELDGQSSQR